MWHTFIPAAFYLKLHHIHNGILALPINSLIQPLINSRFRIVYRIDVFRHIAFYSKTNYELDPQRTGVQRVRNQSCKTDKFMYWQVKFISEF